MVVAVGGGGGGGAGETPTQCRTIREPNTPPPPRRPLFFPQSFVHSLETSGAKENPSPSSTPPSPGPQRHRCFLFPVLFSFSLARRFHLPLPQVARHVVFIFAGFSARNPVPMLLIHGFIPLIIIIGMNPEPKPQLSG
nr:uncharacterized protein LOC112795312 [Arachis hypogaea]